MVEGIGRFVGIKMLHVNANLFQFHGNICMCCEVSHVILIICCCNNLIHNINPILVHGCYSLADEKTCLLMLKAKNQNVAQTFPTFSLIKG
jgi:hypothetical protein